MSNFLIPEGARDLFVSDTGDDSNKGGSLTFPKLTLAASKTAADTLIPVIGNPVVIIDAGSSTYPENMVIPDNVFVDIRNGRMIGDGGTGVVITAGANAVANFLTIQTSAVAGGTAYSTVGKSRIGINAPSIILNGTGQTGVLIPAASNQIFMNISQILSLDTGNILLDHQSTEGSCSYSFNEFSSSAASNTGIRYNSTSSDIAEVRGGSIMLTGPNTTAIEVLNGEVAAYINVLKATTPIHVASGGTLDIFNADIIGDIVVDVGGTLNCTINSLTGIITNNGTINGKIENDTYGDQTILDNLLIKGNLNIGGTTNVASALLQLDSTVKGFLPPRMTGAQRDAISSPPGGLIVYDVTKDKLDFFGSTSWQGILSAPASTLTVGSIPFAIGGHQLNDDSGLAWNNTTKEFTVTQINSPKIVAAGGNPIIQIEETDAALDEKKWRFQVNAGIFKLETINDAENIFTPRIEIDRSTGAISFKNGDVTIANDLAVNGKLGIGTTLPNAPLEVNGLPAGTVGGFPSGSLHITNPGSLANDNAVLTGHNSLGGNTQLWYLGSSSSSNQDVAFINRQNADLFFSTNNIERLRISNSGNVGIGINAPNSTLHVEGSVSKSIVSKTATYTLTSSDYTVEVDATSGNLIANLPTAVGIKGRIYIIAKTDSSVNTVTVDPFGAEQVGKNLTVILADQDESITIQSNGTNWRPI